jgi:hypothetical protein
MRLYLYWFTLIAGVPILALIIVIVWMIISGG